MNIDPASLSCAVSSAGPSERITLAHGEGGWLMRKLLAERVFPALRSAATFVDADAAVLPMLCGQPVFTTDSFVVSPLVFPGGDIGRLAVFGTVNDLAVAGARPLWISLSLVIEEGLELAVFDAVLASVAAAAREAGVAVVAGDTKVVPRGAADRLFINTSGLGEAISPLPGGPAAIQPGAEILVSGPVGRHGVAVMAAREQLAVAPLPMSDCASLLPAVEALRRAGAPVLALRDATRGGAAAVLHEWAAASGCTLAVRESHVPLSAEVSGVCELLGLDPLHVANEGTMLVAVDAGGGEAALAALRTTPVGSGAAIIGGARPRGVSPVVVERGMGRYLPLDEPLGAPLPRIC